MVQVRTLPLKKFTKRVHATHLGYKNLHVMVERLTEDPVENAIINDLIEELKVHGKFNRPIQVGSDFGRKYIANGCHRFCAYYLFDQNSTIEFVLNHEREEPDCIEVTWRVLNPDFDPEDVTFICGRSFPTPSGWIEADGASSNRHGEISFWYYATFDQLPDIMKYGTKKFNDMGLAVELVSCKSVEL